MESVSKMVLKRIHGTGRGSLFTANNFRDLGTRTAVDKALSRLVHKGTLRRLAHGLYDYPKSHPILGILSPHPEKIAKAMSHARGMHIQPSGDYAANLLGLSEQVPARIVYLTDGASRVVGVDAQEIQFRHASPRNMATAGRISGLVIQALRYIGPEHVNDSMIATLHTMLNRKDKKQLLADMAYAPQWMGVHLKRIAAETP